MSSAPMSLSEIRRILGCHVCSNNGSPTALKQVKKIEYIYWLKAVGKACNSRHDQEKAGR